MKIKVQAGPKLRTSLRDFRLEASLNRLRADEALDLKTSFTIAGGLYDVFNPDIWDKAIDLDDEHLRITASLTLIKKGIGPFNRVIVKPIILKRKATFYWTRDPQSPYRVWAMIVDEDSNPYIPGGTEEAKKKFLYFNRVVSIFGSSLGKGIHTLFAEARVRWTRHFYIEKGTARGISNPVQVEVF